MKRKIIAFTLLLCLLTLSGCYPGGATYADELDVVYTVYDKGGDFPSKKTYAIPDKVVKITKDYINGGDLEFVSDLYAIPILDNINANMKAYGWEKVADEDDPDVVFLPAAWETKYVYYWGDYWCWVNPYYCGGWGYPYPIRTSYTTGTLFMNIVDLKPGDSREKSALWTGAVNGLLSNSIDFKRIKTTIDQSFKQSPYLNINSLNN